MAFFLKKFSRSQCLDLALLYLSFFFIPLEAVFRGFD
jgi:hypothetical protein